MAEPPFPRGTSRGPAALAGVVQARRERNAQLLASPGGTTAARQEVLVPRYGGGVGRRQRQGTPGMREPGRQQAAAWRCLRQEHHADSRFSKRHCL